MQILKTKYWKIDICNDQAYLGRGYITLLRKCKNLSGLTKQEQSDFFCIVKKLERAVKLSFGAEMFNWSCLMNGAYQEENPNPQVHWHFRPRYKNKINFEGITFEDKEFGGHYNDKRQFLVSDEILDKIANKIKSNYK
jgi:diadenosine tetraphosphate (Ap4A) HIT family hydrolase